MRKTAKKKKVTKKKSVARASKPLSENDINLAINLIQPYDPAIILTMKDNPQLINLAAIWPRLDIQTTVTARKMPDRGSEAAIATWAWTACQIDIPEAHQQIRMMLGEAFPAVETLKQAMSLGVVLPFGNLHRSALAFVSGYARATYDALRASLAAPPAHQAAQDRPGETQGQQSTSGGQARRRPTRANVKR